MDLKSQLAWYLISKIVDSMLGWARIYIANRIRRRSLTKQAQRVAHAFEIFSASRIKTAQFEIKKIGRIVRQEIQEIINTWNGGIDGILLIGEAGSGKSGIAHNLGQLLRGQAMPVLFIDATDIPIKVEPVRYISDLLPIDIGLIEAFSILGSETECCFIVDQLDSLGPSEALLGFVGLLKSLCSIPGVRILAVSRTYEADEIAPINELDFPWVDSETLREEAVTSYLEELGFAAPSEFILDLAKNLLNLSLIAEIIDANGTFRGIVSETSLWVRYIETIKDREGQDSLAWVLEMASDTLNLNEREFEGPLIPRSEIRRLISREILIIPSLGRLRFRHERLQEFLCAYRLFPKRVPAIDLFNKYGDLKGRKVVQWFHSLLHLYDHEMESRFVSEALSLPDDVLAFYSRVAVLDVLKEQNDPTDTVAATLKTHLKNEIYEKYFFEGLGTQAWVDPLCTAGYFDNPPDPVEVQPGLFRYPLWHGGDYLVRFAEYFPEIVVEMASTIQSENGHALGKLLDALLKIPANLGAGSSKNISNWIPTIRGWFDPVKLGKFMGHLTEGGHSIEALFLLDALLTPLVPVETITDDRIRYRLIDTTAKIEDYWLEQIWNDYGNRLISKAPIDVAEVLERNLVKSIELEQELYEIPEGETSHSRWRSAIGDHPQNTSIHKLNDLLVNGLRDAVLQICIDDPGEGEEILSKYLSSNHSILRRIALYTLRYYGPQYSNLLADVFQKRNVLNDSDIHHELYWLLTEQFPNLDLEVKQRLISWLFEGPEDTEWISKWIIEQEGKEKHDEELKRHKDWWTIRRMWAIRRFLEGKDKDRFENLVNEYDEPDHPDFLSWSTGVGRITHDPPLTKEYLSTIQFERIIQEIKDYTPETPSIEFAREGLAEALNAAVDEDPHHFLGLAPLLMDQDIRFIYTYHYLMAMKTAIERNEDLERKPILELCAFVASIEEDPHDADKDTYEAGLRAAQYEVANLLESICKKEPPYLKDADIDAIREILDKLLVNPDPDPENEIQSGWDPAMRSLNCVRGQAMHGLFHLARYLDGQMRQEQGEEEFKPQFDPYIRGKLEEKLDKTNDKSVSVHSVFGWYTPLLGYYDKHWIETNIPHIFPEEPENERYWHAAWDAYVSYNNVYKRPFLMLIPQYHRAISTLGEPEDPDRLGTTKGERLAEHLIYAYIHQLIDLDSGDGLIPSFFENADDNVRGHVAFWLVKAFGELKLDREDPIWQRMWELFRWRFETASHSGNVNKFQEEISSYMRWLELTPAEFRDIEPYIRMAIPFLKEGYHKKLVADYLASHCEHFPRESICILHQVLIVAEMAWYSLYEENVGKIIQAAIGSEDDAAKEEAILVINLLGERGDFQWKKYLPGE